MKIAAVDACIVDIPTIRAHKLAFGSISQQSYVIVQIRLENGMIGIGEAATIGGPSWSEETPESILHIIENYLGPALIGRSAQNVEGLLALFEKLCKGNWFAKAAVEMALIDAAARTLDIPAYQLLGGKVHDSLPLAWTLATGDPAKDIAEAERLLEERKHRIFKIKIGAQDPQHDVARVAAIAKAVAGRASVQVDINQGWDEVTARRYVPQLGDAGVALVEQPVARWNLDAMARLCAEPGPIIMADEGACSPRDVYEHGRRHAAHAIALKVTKAGGLLNTRRAAAVAEAAGMACYGGCMLETSVGTAASAHVFATIPGITLGCELFGPRLLVDDITVPGIEYADFSIRIPDGPGFGVQIDTDKLAHYRRA